MKRWISLIIALIALMTMGAHAEGLEKIYSEAELMMVAGDYTGAAAKFDALGAYSDASQMAMYCKAVAAAETLGMYDVAVDAFTKLGDFKDSNQMAVYYLARGHEAAGAAVGVLAEASDDALNEAAESYENAVTIYAELSLFKDSLNRMAACQEQITAIEAEQTARKEAATEEKYQQAVTLETEGKYAEALNLYRSLNNYKDSNTRAAACQSIIDAENTEAAYQNALALEAAGKYEEAVEAFEALEGYKDSNERRAACEMIIAEAMYQEARRLEREQQYTKAEKLYNKISGYADSDERAKACRNKEAYGYARSVEKETLNGEYFEALGDYRDSKERLWNYQKSAAMFPSTKQNSPNTSIGNYSYGVDAKEAIAFFKEYREDFALVDSEEAQKLTGSDWMQLETVAGNDYGYRFVYHFEEGVYSQIGGIIEGKYKSTSFKDQTYMITDGGVLSGFYHDYQMRKLFEDYYILYKADSAGEYTVPAYLMCKVTVNGDVITFAPLPAQSEIAKYKDTAQIPLTFAAKSNDSLETWLVSEEKMAMLAAALLVESGDYIDFQHYGLIPETYVAVYNQQMLEILIGMDDYTILFSYIPDQEVLMCQKIDKLVLNPEHANSILAGFDNGKYTNISTDVWYQLFDSVGESEENIIECWTSGSNAVYMPEGTQQFDFSIFVTDESSVSSVQEDTVDPLSVYSDKETVKSAQAALNAAGYDCGTPDGIAGKGTAAAISQYQTDKTLNVTGTVTHELLISLGVIEE